MKIYKNKFNFSFGLNTNFKIYRNKSIIGMYLL